MPKIKIISFLIVLIYFSNFKILISDGTNFILGMEDIPIFKKMENLENGLVVFDTNNGRFVSNEIFGKVNLTEAKDFYKKILPNLGWQKKSDNLYSRDNELLSIKFFEKNKISYIYFSISPNK